ncbi:acireductone synthase [Acanthopleuribacter pedis]|uniref:Multifunctional fusion protein n=1 Tax=Acanthopleuribacter pedis TaxID=442870 RepID=A0A8J7QFV3_9BACT|nr:acireductone synthase [Acanthopleuribacter pedis]MBO1317783.1 acireductone synthase [Acanthopleuribacter pedis]
MSVQSSLTIYAEQDPQTILEHTVDGDRIAELLAGVGIKFERWEANKTLADDADQDAVLAAYADDVARIKEENGFQSVDVVRLKAGHPDRKAFRQKFLAEHIHAEDEVRFFVEGSGWFYLHLDDKIYVTQCVQNDFIHVPAGTKHWFDMGNQPEFAAIRFFTNPEGWVAQWTDNPIALNFPMYVHAEPVKAVVTDIEGTTSSISFVKDVLFPYAKEHLAAFVAAQGDAPQVAAILDQAREESGQPDADNATIAQTMLRWIDEDRKVTPLKAIQGLIWEKGYRDGDFQAHLYDDAHAALKQWADSGLALYIFSSGSIKAQHLMFEHTTFGDLRPWFKGYFDTTTGPKKEAESYRKIAAEIGVDPHEILFLSDVVAELDGARAAGMQTRWLVRDGQQPAHPFHTQTDTFATIQPGAAVS